LHCQPNVWRLSCLADIRYLVIILTGILYSRFGVRALSLGQVGCSRVLGEFIIKYIILSQSTYLFYSLNK
jgi:hypothetical protein